MELNEQQCEEYCKGYNHAQIIAEHDPQLLAAITADVNAVDDYFNGFFDFKRDHEKMASELSDLRNLRDGRNREQEYEKESR